MNSRRHNLTTLLESARVGADSLPANPARTVLSTTGVIIGVAALVFAFAITDGVDVWSRQLIARESSVQDVATLAVGGIGIMNVLLDAVAGVRDVSGAARGELVAN